MRIVKPTFEILDPAPFDRNAGLYLYRKIERAARTCYRSEDLMTEDSAVRMVKMLVERGHEAMLEHADVSVRFTVDRGITHELVRYRHCSPAQESTRYCNYSKGRFGGEISYIPLGEQLEQYDLNENQIDEIARIWTCACADAEMYYNEMIQVGAPPEIARSVLNHSTASSIVVKTNLREWLAYFYGASCWYSRKGASEIHMVMVRLLGAFNECMPEVFGDIWTWGE